MLTQTIAFIYSFDTSTGVCPSLHVAYSMGILSVFWKDRKVSRLWKGFLLFFVLGVCAAVCFVKQHSVLDVFAALPVCVLAEWLVYGKRYWLPKWRKREKPVRARPLASPHAGGICHEVTEKGR